MGEYDLTYRVNEVSYYESFKSGFISLELKDFKFGKGNGSIIGVGAPSHDNIWLYLDSRTLFEQTGLYWDGSKESVGKLKGNLEGKTFTLDLGIKEKK